MFSDFGGFGAAGIQSRNMLAWSYFCPSRGEGIRYVTGKFDGGTHSDSSSSKYMPKRLSAGDCC